ncbi:hypothetical protein F511_26973 [Dorcoceras hygrometricum]|uniref:Uncharacterized protein n=1 Tax=Dorcoceras hygrometricum TaxID=472368 RepID=A0A2Z7CVE2_9LAMI|nr:hypothetical protein F511_26973 [Dorcoceras hygrometricum]
MKVLFSSTNVHFKPSSKKKDMKVGYILLNDIVTNSLTAKAGSFDVVTTERFDMMVAINIGLKINWEHLSILLENLVKADLGESVALHPLKVLNSKSVLTYLKKNQAAPQSGEASKVSGDKADEAVEPKKMNLTHNKLAAGDSAAPAQSRSETIPNVDEHPLVKPAVARLGGQVTKAKSFLCHQEESGDQEA